MRFAEDQVAAALAVRMISSENMGCPWNGAHSAAITQGHIARDTTHLNNIIYPGDSIFILVMHTWVVSAY